MKLTLRKSEWLDEWYVLEGGSNWAQVEGTKEEWLSIAEGLAKTETVLFRRCAAFAGGSCWELYSPRNRSGPDDCVLVEYSEADQLAKHIREVLA